MTYLREPVQEPAIDSARGAATNKADRETGEDEKDLEPLGGSDRYEPGDGWRIRTPTRELASGECAGVWWRRPEVPAAPPASAHAGDAIADQWRAFVRALADVPGPVWVAEIRPTDARSRQNEESPV
jgi:hypothetical protein